MSHRGGYVRKIDFNQGWTVRCLSRDDAPRRIDLPHDAMRYEARSEDSQGAGNIAYFGGYDYEYAKRFELDPELKGCHATLEFEGAYHDAEVYLNGERVAGNSYGYTPFYAELDAALRWDAQNELRVVTHNADQPNSRWYSGSGIYRPVWLHVFEDAHILLNGIKIETIAIDSARVAVSVETSSTGEVIAEIFEGERKILSGAADAGSEHCARFDFDIPDVRLWSPDDPFLYGLKVTFGSDERSLRFGVRTLAWSAERGFEINGERVILKGACIHHDNGILGACTYPDVERRRVRILKEAGYNAIRSAHNPASTYLLDACDELGMLVMDEYVDVWYMHKTAYDYASHVRKNWRTDLKAFVERDFNHPSVIMYSTGNEVAESAREEGIELQRAFTEYLHELDATRPVTCGINIFFNFLSSVGLGVYSDEKAKKEAEQAAQAAQAKEKKAKKRHVGSEFFNSLATKLGTNFMKFGATLPPCDWKTRGIFSAMDIAGYNYGIWRYKRDSKAYPERIILGSETLIGDAYDFYEQAKANPQVIGDFVWAGWDYIGECGDASPEFPAYITENEWDRVRGGTCRIDMTGKLTAEAYYTRVAFELDKGPYLAVEPLGLGDSIALTGWQLTRAQRSWSYPGHEGETTTVEVYARAASVNLIVNGDKVASKRLRKDCRAKFKVPYEAGTLLAVAYDETGAEIGRDSLTSASSETELRLIAEGERAKAGEMVFLRAMYCDASGIVKPLERHDLTFEVEGGELMGAANGCCSFEGNFTSAQTPTYLGEAQAIVRAVKAGPIRVCVKDGEREAACTIEVDES